MIAHLKHFAKAYVAGLLTVGVLAAHAAGVDDLAANMVALLIPAGVAFTPNTKRSEDG